MLVCGSRSSNMAFTMNGSSEAGVSAPIDTGYLPNGPLFGPDTMSHHYHCHRASNYHYQSGQPHTTGEYRQETNHHLNNDSHITVLQIDQNQASLSESIKNYNCPPYAMANCQVANSSSSNGVSESDFVTVLQIASASAPMTSTVNSYYTASSSHSTATCTSTTSSQKVFVDNRKGEIEEEVTIYRLPGERLGMALRFDGGSDNSETIRRVFVQSITENSPASKAIGLMLGILREGDEILQIERRNSSSLTRIECITLLKDAPVRIRLVVRRSFSSSVACHNSNCYPPITVPNCFQPSTAACCQMLQTVPFESVSTLTQKTLTNQNHINSESWQQKKVPPPVPPRMATTTLSSKRKSPTMSTENNLQNASLPEVVVSCGSIVPIEMSPPIEKPPRRKNLQQPGNPPPLPPRRPKGPPPKPPTVSVVSASSVTLASTSITTTSTESLPSLVTVITTKVCDVVSNSHCQLSSTVKESSACLITPSVLSSTTNKASSIKTSTTSKVTFTISNSKVSSFIRQTAEKLHRKLSGKSNSTEDDGHKSSHNGKSSGNKSHSVRVSVSSENTIQVKEETPTPATITITKPVLEQKPESVSESESQIVSSASLPTAAAFYVDSCQEADAHSFIESDTDDTSSSVSTIIERSSLSNAIFDSLAPHFDNSPYFGHKVILPETEFELHDNFKTTISPCHTASIVDRVLSPFERLEREFDNDTQLGPFSSLSSFANGFSCSTVASEYTFRSLSLLPNQSINENIDHQQVQLSLNKTCELIVDDQLAASMSTDDEGAKNGTCTEKSPISIPVDADSRRDYENVHEMPIEEKSIEPTERLTRANTLELLELPKEFASTEQVNQMASLFENNGSTTSDVDKIAMLSETAGLNPIVSDDDEDFDDMKNDIISRVDDDKDDFMLDTNYLKESSSRYLFHHSGSELILAPYSELSSITEEDEEDETINSSHDNKQSSFMDDFPVQTRLPVTADYKIEPLVERKAVTTVECTAEKSEAIKVVDSVANCANGYWPEKVKDTSAGHIELQQDDSDARSSSSNSSSPKVSLNNVFDFLNEAADDFEFVERMLELTNDKIDSIDDIMRIRESLRGLQQSEKRDNLQRFLDGKDVIDELMALSSSTQSTASSLNSESPVSDVLESDLIAKSKDNKQPRTIGRVMPKPTLSIDMNESNHDVSDDFASLPVSFAHSGRFLPIDNHRIRPHLGHQSTTNGIGQLCKNKSDHRMLSNGNLSKIPTLTPKVPSQNMATGTLGKRSQSVSNIFNRSSGFSSLIELKPSLIPRPISNFNLSLPSPSLTSKLNPSIFYRSPGHSHISHNCLNRSTSMQSIPTNSFNSLSRSAAKSTTPVRRSSVTSQLSGSNNYHQQCHRNHEPSPTYYGSLSRSISKSTANVYSTGSLPRPNKMPQLSKPNQFGANQSQHLPTPSGHYSSNCNLRTSSMIDLSYGFSVNKPRTGQQSIPATVKSSRRHSSSNLFQCDSIQSGEDPTEQYQTPLQQNSLSKCNNSKPTLRNSSSLVSLLPPATQLTPHFWHCSHHTSSSSLSSISPPSSDKSKRTSGPLNNKLRSNLSQAQLNGKSGKLPSRKSSKSLSSNSSSSSTKSESDEQQVPQTRSILRHSCISKYKTHVRHQPKVAKEADDKKELDYWKQTIEQRKHVNYDLNSHSDSESSDITNSSGDCSADCHHSLSSKAWRPKRRNSHKVCFVDEIVQHPASGNTTRDIDYQASMEAQQVDGDRQMHCTEERFDSSSSPEVPILSSSTSTSSIASLSSGELAKACTGQLRPTKLADQQTLSNNGILSKSYYLPVTTQREDSGIFDRSDDTSTSEFSQSPSPDLLIGVANQQKKQHKQSDEIEPQSMKERIAFFDPVTNKTLDLGRSYSCNKSGLSPVNTLVNGPVLSRSSSAPYETHCELNAKLSQPPNGEDILLTPPQSPPNEWCKEAVHQQLQTEGSIQQSIQQSAPHFPLAVRVNTTAYPVTFEYKRQGPFSLRDTAITARRFQNTCKLKGLVIPESIISPQEEEARPVPCMLPNPEIDLPTIISEETFKVKSSKVFTSDMESPSKQSTEERLLSETEKPIEFVDIKSTSGDIPKYSPMFKRRPLSLPVNPEINYGSTKVVSTETLSDDQIQQVVTHKLPTPPAVPPKPKVSQLSIEIPINKTDDSEPPPSPPVIPPRMAETKVEVVSESAILTTQQDTTNNVEKQIEPPVVTECLEPETTRPSNAAAIPESRHDEFVIHQKQYSMRVIVFELTESDDSAQLGIGLTGGLDSLYKEVTVEHIEPNSLASLDGRLQPGDRIVSINGKLLLGLTHEETVQLLQNACHSQRVMVVFSRSHEQNGPEVFSPNSITSPSILGSMSFTNTQLPVSSVPSVPLNSTDANYKNMKAEITKDVNGHGFIIEGGKNPSFGDRPIVIKRIFRGGPVDKEGSLLEGDELLSINEQSVQGMSRAEAWNFLRQLPDGKVTLITRRKKYF